MGFRSFESKLVEVPLVLFPGRPNGAQTVQVVPETRSQCGTTEN